MKKMRVNRYLGTCRSLKVSTVLLNKEVSNLLKRVGEGFVAADYYAPDRYYSQIKGVKNIRIKEYYNCGICVMAKVDGYYVLPLYVIVNGVKYRVLCENSKNFSI